MGIKSVSGGKFGKLAGDGTEQCFYSLASNMRAALFPALRPRLLPLCRLTPHILSNTIGRAPLRPSAADNLFAICGLHRRGERETADSQVIVTGLLAGFFSAVRP